MVIYKVLLSSLVGNQLCIYASAIVSNLKFELDLLEIRKRDGINLNNLLKNPWPIHRASQVVLVVKKKKKLACQCRKHKIHLSDPWVGKIQQEVANHSRILAGKIPWTDDLGGLQSTGSQRVRHNWRKWAYKGEKQSVNLSLRNP